MYIVVLNVQADLLALCTVRNLASSVSERLTVGSTGFHIVLLVVHPMT